jgi:hypothetical protein
LSWSVCVKALTEFASRFGLHGQGVQRRDAFCSTLAISAALTMRPLYSKFEIIEKYKV